MRFGVLVIAVACAHTALGAQNRQGRQAAQLSVLGGVASKNDPGVAVEAEKAVAGGEFGDLPPAGEEPLDAIVRDDTERDYGVGLAATADELKGEHALMQFSLLNGTTAILFGRKCQAYAPIGDCVTHDTETVHSIGRAVYKLCGAFTDSVCACRMEDADRAISCLCSSEELERTMLPAPANTTEDVGATGATGATAVATGATGAELPIDPPLPEHPVPEEPVPTADFGAETRLGSCDDTCAGTQFGNYTLCYARCMVDQTGARLEKLQEQEAKQEAYLDQVSGLLHGEKSVLRKGLLPDSEEADAASEEEAEKADGSNNAWRLELQHLHDHTASQLNLTRMAIAKASKKQGHWMRALGQYTEAQATEQQRRTHLAERQTFKEGHLAQLREELLRRKLEETNAMLRRLQERYEDVSGEIKADPEVDAAAAKVLEDVAHARATLVKRLQEQQEQLASAQKMMLTAPSAKVEEMVQKLMRAVARTQSDLGRYSDEAAELASLRKQLYTTQAHQANVTQWLVLARMGDASGNGTVQLEELQDRLKRDVHRLQAMLDRLTSTVPEGTECKSAHDCGYSQLCDAGKCNTTLEGMPCEPGTARWCGNGMQCVEEKCRGVANAIACSKDEECGVNQACVHSRCRATYTGLPRAPVMPGDFCTDVLDCGDGQTCREGTCQTVDTSKKCDATDACGNGFRCMNTEVPAEKEEAAEEDGAAGNGTAKASIVMIEKRCQKVEDKAECSSPRACGNGQMCVEAKCFSMYGRLGGRCPPGSQASAKRVSVCLDMVRGSPVHVAMRKRLLSEGAVRNVSGVLEPADGFRAMCDRIEADPTLAASFASELELESHVTSRSLSAARAASGSVQDAVMAMLEVSATTSRRPVGLDALQLWISASEGVQAEHGVVSRVVDRSGHGRDATPGLERGLAAPQAVSVAADSMGAVRELTGGSVPHAPALRFLGAHALTTAADRPLALQDATVVSLVRFRGRGHGANCVFSIGDAEESSRRTPRMSLARNAAGHLVVDAEGEVLVADGTGTEAEIDDGEWLVLVQVRRAAATVMDAAAHELYVLSKGSGWKETRLPLQAQEALGMGISFDTRPAVAAAPVCDEPPCTPVAEIPVAPVLGSARIGACNAQEASFKNRSLDADVVEVMVYDRALSTEERASVEFHLLRTTVARLVGGLAAAEERRRATLEMTAYGDGVLRHGMTGGADAREEAAAKLHWELQQVMQMLDERGGVEVSEQAAAKALARAAVVPPKPGSPAAAALADALTSDVTRADLMAIRDRLLADLARLTGQPLSGDAMHRFVETGAEAAAMRAEGMARSAMSLPREHALSLVESTAHCMCDTVGQFAPENEQCDVGSLRSAVPDGTSCTNVTLCGVAQRCEENTCKYTFPGRKCKSGAECGNGQRCVTGFCRSVPEGVSCERSRDCGNTQICYEHKCYGWFVGASFVADRMRPILWGLEAKKALLVSEMERREKEAHTRMEARLEELQKMREKLAEQRKKFADWLKAREAREKGLNGQTMAGLEAHLAEIMRKIEDLQRQQARLRRERLAREKSTLEDMAKERELRERLEKELERLQKVKDSMDMTGEGSQPLEKGESGLSAVSAARKRVRSVEADQEWEDERSIGNLRGGVVNATSKLSQAGRLLPSALLSPDLTAEDLDALEADKEVLEACRHNETLARALLGAERRRVEGERAKWEETVVRMNRPRTCAQLLGLATGGTDGVYTVFPPEHNVAHDQYHGAQVYCDMTVEGGGWTLLGYGDGGALGGLLTAQHGKYDPTKRTGSANVNGLWTTQASKEMVVAWTEDYAGGKNDHPTGGIASYQYAVRFTIPNPGVQTVTPEAGAKTCDSGAYSPVTVECLRGKCGMPKKMFTGTDSLGACYGHAYGLIAGDGHKCDVDLDLDADSLRSSHAALYLSVDGTPGCTGVLRNGKPVKTTTMSIWVR